MTAARRRTFPLLPRRRFVGTAFGTLTSMRRGSGTDVAGSRPYQPGDRLAAIDWHASARLSAAKGSDEFVVRQTFAEDAPRVVVICDRRPSMSLYARDLPFLSKPDAVRECVTAISASARAARAEIGWCDVARDELWLAPSTVLARGVVERRLASGWDGPHDGLDRALRTVVERQTEAPAGTFVFAVSDFLSPIDRRVWHAALGRGLDVVPVIVQDPVWEASFPEVGGVTVPIADPEGGRGVGTRLSTAEASARRAANEARAQELRDAFRRIGADSVVVTSAAADAVDGAFADWAARRRLARRSAVLR